MSRSEETEENNDNEEIQELIQWHPIFLKSLNLLVKDGKGQSVKVQDEISLSSSPLRIDNAVILSHNKTRLKHPITWMFDSYNLIEFKSPKGYLKATDFDKLIAYARLHQVLKKPKEDLLDCYTISCFSTSYPRAMFKRLKKRGLVIKEADPVPGIYRVYGEMYRIQVIVFNYLKDPDLAWMFAPFIKDRALEKLEPYIKLAAEIKENPANQEAQDLFDFGADHGLIPPEQLEVIIGMLRKISDERRKAYYDILDRAETLAPWRKQLKDEGRDEGIVMGEIKKSREFIQKLLVRKFGDRGKDIQPKVMQLNTPEILDFVLEELFAASTVQEAKAVINDGIAEENKLKIGKE